MKGYCTAQDVRNALAPLDQQDEVATAARLSDPQLNDAIAEAEGIVDTYISMRYTVSLVPTEIIPDPDFPDTTTTVDVASAPIRGATRDIAAVLAALTSNKGKDMTEDDPIRFRYGIAMGVLTAIRSGKANLDPDFFPPVDQDSDVEVVNLYEPAMFGPSDVGLWPAGYAPQILSPLRRW